MGQSGRSWSTLPRGAGLPPWGCSTWSRHPHFSLPIRGQLGSTPMGHLSFELGSKWLTRALCMRKGRASELCRPGAR